MAVVGRVTALLGLIFLMWHTVTAVHAAAIEGRGYRMAGDATRTRIVIQFDREPDLKWFMLRGPHRLVFDFPDTTLAFDSKELEARGLVAGVRYGKLSEEHSRLILTGRGPFTVENVAVLENEASSGYRLVADIVASSESEFEAALAAQTLPSRAAQRAPKGDRIADVPDPEHDRFVVVLDPGHGGIDSGANGVGGTAEKDITLAFALELREKLREAGHEVLMTREGDEFLRLDERVRIARQHAADLLISIHADTIRHKWLRGATVYTMSEKASDADAAATAARENLADEIAGMHFEGDNEEVADILMDLVRRETHGYSARFARSLIGSLSKSIQLINNPHRSAGFKVLRAPDVPSVLLELGYLSNPRDEEQLKDPEWRSRAIGSVAAAVKQFAIHRSGAGG